MRRFAIIYLSSLAILVFALDANAATLAQQRTELNRINTLLRAAERLANQKKGEEAVKAFTDAQDKLQALAKEGVDERLKRNFSRTIEVTAEQHKTLSAAGLKLPELASIDAEAAIQSPDKPGGRFNTDDVSFSKDVAPILAAKCGTCHIDQRRGTFSLATYNALMQGSQRGGRVITPGEGVGSVMVDLIESGDMPRGGGAPVTPQELAAIVKWINQGAKFDGTNPDQSLRMLGTPAGAAPAPMPAPMPVSKPAPLVRATGKETVSFALDVAPILIARCNDCHGGNNASGNLSFATFTQLLKGGDSGTIVGKADPEETLLIKKLRGTAGQRMPLNRPPLSDDEIARIATWIREGSKFDGPDPGETIQRTSAVVRADRATSEELSQIRADLAAQNWHLALPDEKPSQVATERFLLIGNVPEQQLREWGQVAESQVESVLKTVRGGDAPLSKGRMTLYVFGNRIDYGEFATMVERRDADKGERGTWAFDIVDAYGCVLPTLEAAAENESLIAQQIAAIALAERGKGRLPDWLVEGAARAVVAKLSPRNARVAGWQEQLPTAAAALKQPDDFMQGRLAPEPTGIISYAFVTPLMRNARNFDKLVDQVAAGDSVDEALKKTYRYDGKQLAKMWFDAQQRGGR